MDNYKIYHAENGKKIDPKDIAPKERVMVSAWSPEHAAEKIAAYDDSFADLPEEGFERLYYVIKQPESENPGVWVWVTATYDLSYNSREAE